MPNLLQRTWPHGFHHPKQGWVFVECCAPGATPEEAARNAAANRVFLEKFSG